MEAVVKFILKDTPKNLYKVKKFILLDTKYAEEKNMTRKRIKAGEMLKKIL